MLEHVLPMAEIMSSSLEKKAGGPSQRGRVAIRAMLIQFSLCVFITSMLGAHTQSKLMDKVSQISNF